MKYKKDPQTGITHLVSDDHESTIQRLEDILQRAKDGEFKDFMFAAFTETGEVATAYAGLDFIQRQNLVSHMQLDIVHNMVAANFFEEE